jgi:peptidyl-tRNA hydrolase, PTH1 family
VPSPLKLIVGLGNPGPAHLMTRHNAGYWFVDILARKYSLTFHNEARFQAEICRLTDADYDCLICKPTTFMNRSGQSVQAVSSYYRIDAGEILVVHDEIDLDVGTVRLKQGGGHGGNNGIRDIIEKLGVNNFNRLRIGVGHPGSSDQVTGYVLDRPSAEDEDLIIQAINSVMDQLPYLLAGEFQKLMNMLHRSSITDAEVDSKEDTEGD